MPAAGKRASLAGVLAQVLLDLVLPVSCAGCATPTVALCPGCAPLLAGSAWPTAPHPGPPGFPRCWAVAGYDGAVRSAVIAYKERGRRDLLRPLGSALATAVRAGATGPVLLIPVPSAPAAVRARGTDTTGRLATAAAALLRRTGVPAAPWPVLRLRRRTQDSAGLNAADRMANLAGAMAADPRRLTRRRTPPASLPTLVLVDDLVTTGASLAEAARALAVAGYPAGCAAVVAATVRRVDVGLRSAAR